MGLERRQALPVVAAGACALGFAAVAVLALNNASAQARDVDLLGHLVAFDRPDAQRGLEAVAYSVDPLPYALLGLACIGVAVARRRPWRAVAVAVLLVGTGATAQILKHVLAEQRFVPWLGFGQIDAASFPSGHATAVATLALCAVLVAAPAWRPWVALAGGAWALAVAYATLALAWHYPSDVLAGFLLAGAWFSAVVALLQRVEPHVAARPDAGDGVQMVGGHV
jgi:membrane-associated phospholipid phosphatase